MRSNPLAASMVGTASRNENSTIVVRLRPKESPPTMVAAERETPGIIAIDWKSPIKKASRYEIEEIFFSTTALSSLWKYSNITRAIPPKKSDQRTIDSLQEICFNYLVQ